VRRKGLFEKRILAEIPCKLCHPKVHNNQFLAAIRVLKLPQRCSWIILILKYCVTSLAVVLQTPREGEQYRRITKISTGPLSVVWVK